MNPFEGYRIKNVVKRKILGYSGRVTILDRENDEGLHNMYFDKLGPISRDRFATAVRIARTQINTYYTHGDKCLEPGYVFEDFFFNAIDSRTNTLPWLTFEMEKINE